MRLGVAAVLTLLASAVPAISQHSVDPHFTYHRVICVVPLIGTGAAEDPIRPDHIPASGAGKNGIIGFYHEVSDDGKWALAEIVAADRSALLPILDDARPGVWVVEKGTVSRAVIQAKFQRYKKTINLDRFGVAVR